MSTRLLAGRYELQEKIGDGGMAVVYKARCRLLNRYVAIKILKPEFARNVKFIENFRKESQAAASMSHPNIVNIYDVGREGNVHYIVMELIEGHILSDMIAENGALEWRRAVEITKQIASALSFAHKSNIIHRDVKPHNILITEDGTAKITDFGIAKAINSSDMGDETNTIMGSVHYFSPEQARGGYVDEKSDIYSLGIVMYEMLTGQVPFDGENPVAVALMHINEEMPSPRGINPKIPEAIEKVVMKATNKFQVDRYESADEMYEALQDAEFAVMMEASTAIHGVAGGTGSQGTANAANMGKTENRDGEKNTDDVIGEKAMSGKGKFRINKTKIIAVIVAFICALPLSIFIASMLTEAEVDETFEVPDFRGMTFESAKLVATEKGLEIVQGDSVYTSEYNADTICSQVPDVKSTVKPGNKVTVNISKGVRDGMIPNLVGKSYDDAIFALEKYGFKEGSISRKKSDLPKGIIISQKPNAGEEANPGSSVDFVISDGVEEDEVVMPLLVDMTEAEAKATLEDKKLKLGSTTYEKSDAYAAGKVMWQSQEAQKTIKTETAVDIKVSTGNTDPEPVVPSVYVDYAGAQNDVFWLTVTVSDESGTHNIITRAQRIKADGGETVYLEGVGVGTVTIIFDNDVVGQYSVDFNTGAVN